MRTARVSANVALAPEAATRLWRDPDRWSSFVEGFARVLDRSPGWPAVDERVVWESIPGGRGRVTEKVLECEPAHFATMIFEDAMVGRQTIAALPDAAGAQVELSIEYTLTKYGPLSMVADALFIRRALRDALARTLYRFGIEAEEEAGLR